MNESAYRMGIIFFFITLGNTFLACVYYSIGLVGDDTCDPDGQTWIVADPLLFPTESYCSAVASSSSISSSAGELCGSSSSSLDCGTAESYGRFVRALYFMLQTLFTIGYGDTVIPVNTKERTFACIFMITGTFIYGLVIANMTSVLANSDVLQMRFRQEMDAMNRYLDMRDVPEGLRQRIKIYFDYVNIKQYGMLEEKVLDSLPDTIRAELQVVAMKGFDKVSFFQGQDAKFKLAVAKHLVIRTYAPGSTLIFEGEKQRELIIVRMGQIELYASDAVMAICSLREGDFIGDYQLLFSVPHKYAARANAFVETVVLTISGLMEVLADDDFADRRKECKAGHFRGSKDKGVIDTKTSYEERMAKYNKLYLNVTKKNNKMADMMAVVEDSGKKGIIMPYDPFHVYWDVLLLVATTYQCLAIPIRIDREVFNYTRYDKTAPFDPLLFVDYFFDFIFIVDMYLNARVFAYNEISAGRAEVITDKSLIAENYFASSRSTLDAVACLPLDLLGFAFGNWSYIRLLHLLRFFSVTSIIKEFSTHMTDVYDKIVSNGVRTSLTMFIWTLIMAVWTCVAWNCLHFVDHPDYQAGGPLEGFSTFVPSLYWTFTTFTTVGYGDIFPETVNETLFASSIGAIGAVSAAAVIANVSSFLHSTSVTEDNIDHRRKTVAKYLSDQSISSELQDKLETYYKFIDEDRMGIEESTFLKNTLPTNLRDDMMLHITSDMVLNCAFLSDVESGFIRSVMLNLEQRFYAQDQYVLDSVTPANGMFFIKSGVIELFTPEGALSDRVGLNACFAEDALLNPWEKNPFTAKCVGDCEVWFFGRPLFNALLNEWPTVREKLGKLEAKASTARRRSSVCLTTHLVAPTILAVQVKDARVFHPDGVWIMAWKTVLVVAIMYNAIIVPFRFAFSFDIGYYFDKELDTDVEVEQVFNKINPSSVVIDYLCDLVYLGDIIIHARFLGFVKSDVYYYQPSAIFKHFINNTPWMRMIFAFLPFEILLVAISPEDYRLSFVQFFSILRINRIVRIVEVDSLSEYVQRSLRKRDIKMHKNAVRLIKILVATFTCAHYMGSVFFSIGLRKHVLREGNSWVDTACIMTNVNHDGAADGCPSTGVNGTSEFADIGTQYVTSLYWSIATLTTVGYGDITANQGNVMEVYYNIFTLIMGTLIYTLIIANLEDMVSQLDTTMSLFKEKLDGVKQYSNQQNLTDELSGKILTYFEHLWQHQSGVDGNSLLGYMPRTLRQQVINEQIGHHMKKMFYVKDCNRDFMERVVSEMKTDKYMPDDVVFHGGELATTLFILYRGKIKLISQQTGIEYTTLSDCMVGEGEFFTRALQPCTGIATVHADVFTLSFDSFWSVLSEERLVGDFKNKLVEKAEYLNKNCVAFMIEKLKANMKNAKMAKMMNVEMEVEPLKYWVSDPGSIFRRVWDLAGFGFTAFLGLHIPYSVAFRRTVLPDMFIADVAACVFFATDTYFKAMHFSIFHEGQLVQKREVFRAIYAKNRMALDVFTTLPIFFIVLATVGLDQPNTGYVWLFSLNTFLRVRRGGSYFMNLIDLIELFTGYRSSSSTIRIMELFLMVCSISHWMGCAYFLVAKVIHEDGRTSWLSLIGMDGMEVDGEHVDMSELGYEDNQELEVEQYVTAFYWALYTISTTGYGNVVPSQNSEKIYCMICMVVGAIVCDAGITAVLTSLIENRDHQAGTNSRRLECCKKYMTQALSGKSEDQKKVLDFFNYEDTELHNIDSNATLAKIGTALRLSIVSTDCEQILRSSELFGKHEPGVIKTIMRHMEACIVIPEEKIIDADGNDTHIYILKTGRARGVDAAGGKSMIQSGSMISNGEYEERMQVFGLPTNSLKVTVHKAWNLPKTDLFGACDPYVSIEGGKHMKMRTTVKKVTRSPSWKEIFYTKLTADVQEIKFTLYDWNRVEDDEFVGGFIIPVSEMTVEEKVVYELEDENGKAGNLGSVSMSLHYGILQQEKRLPKPSMTVTAETYCQMYKVDCKLLKKVDAYIANLEKPEVGDRLPYYDNSETPVEKYKRETIAGMEASKKLAMLAADSVQDLLSDVLSDATAGRVMGKVGEGDKSEGDGISGGRGRAESGASSADHDAFYDIEGGAMSGTEQGQDEGGGDGMFKPRAAAKEVRRTAGKIDFSDFEAAATNARGTRESFQFGFSRQMSGGAKATAKQKSAAEGGK